MNEGAPLSGGSHWTIKLGPWPEVLTLDSSSPPPSLALRSGLLWSGQGLRFRGRCQAESEGQRSVRLSIRKPARVRWRLISSRLSCSLASGPSTRTASLSRPTSATSTRRSTVRPAASLHHLAPALELIFRAALVFLPAVRLQSRRPRSQSQLRRALSELHRLNGWLSFCRAVLNSGKRAMDSGAFSFGAADKRKGKK